DIYQGTELWDLSLVDPDNRRPVDYELRQRLLCELPTLAPERLLARPDDGVIKLFVVHEALELRRRRPAAFGAGPVGAYSPIRFHGPDADHCFGLMRGGRVAVIVPRLASRAFAAAPIWKPEAHCTTLPGLWRNLLTGEEQRGARWNVGALLARFPVA